MWHSLCVRDWKAVGRRARCSLTDLFKFLSPQLKLGSMVSVVAINGIDGTDIDGCEDDSDYGELFPCADQSQIKSHFEILKKYFKDCGQYV